MICCFGGTFDPVHIGHLQGALQVSEALDVDVHMVLSARPSHKRAPAASIDARFEMLGVACAPFPRLKPDAREIARDAPSYTVHTLEALRAEFPEEPLGWVIGRDTLLTLNTWYQWQRVLTLTHLVVLDRAGYDAALAPELRDVVAGKRTSSVPTEPAGAVIDIPGQLPDVSATEIRRRIAAREPVAHLLPTGVFSYIASQQLYGELCDP
ncbi:MAG: nicotinate-nucleotide adenylyltransferase [Pseudomonadales bacterium]